MSKRTLIILSLIVIILGSGAFYLLLGGKAPVVSDIINNLPFGTPPEASSTPSNGGGETPGVIDPNGTAVTENGKPLARFVKISDAPVAGAVSLTKNGSTFVRYVDRATGHIFDVNPATLERTQILNVTEPKIYEALWKADASGFVARSVEDGSDIITNTAIALIPPKSTSTQSLYTAQATLLRGNIADMTVNTDGSLLYSLIDTSSLAVSSFTGERPRTLLILPFTNWRLVPVSSSMALIYTKASSGAAGYAYTLNLSGGSLTKILGPLDALTANLSPDARRMVFGFVSGNTSAFSVLNMTTKNSRSIFPVTLPEKCVWSKKVPTVIFCGSPTDGIGPGEPDLWYQGVTHFSDKVWKINVDTDDINILLDPKGNFSVDIDIEKPILSPTEDYLFFRNKTDLSLWALKLVP